MPLWLWFVMHCIYWDNYSHQHAHTSAQGLLSLFGNKCRFSPGLVLRLLRAVWKTIGTGCQVEGFSFSSPPQRSQRCLCSLSSRFGSLSAVEPHLTFVLFSCGRCMQYRITAMWEMMQRAVCCSSSQGTQSSGFLMVSQLPDVASEMFILSAVWFPALTVTSRINCMIAYSTHRRVD